MLGLGEAMLGEGAAGAGAIANAANNSLRGAKGIRSCSGAASFGGSRGYTTLAQALKGVRDPAKRAAIYAAFDSFDAQRGALLANYNLFKEALTEAGAATTDLTNTMQMELGSLQNQLDLTIRSIRGKR